MTPSHILLCNCVVVFHRTNLGLGQGNHAQRARARSARPAVSTSSSSTNTSLRAGVAWPPFGNFEPRGRWRGGRRSRWPRRGAKGATGESRGASGVMSGAMIEGDVGFAGVANGAMIDGAVGVSFAGVCGGATATGGSQASGTSGGAAGHPCAAVVACRSHAAAAPARARLERVRPQAVSGSVFKWCCPSRPEAVNVFILFFYLLNALHFP